MKQVRRADTRDAEAITTLRITEYSRSPDFKLLKPELLTWSDKDESNIVLGVWSQEDQAIATIRLVRVSHAKEAAMVLKSAVPDHIRYPALVFNAAATCKPYRRRGFNQLLRYYGISTAIAQNIKSLLSPVFQESPRITFMKKLGYVCHGRPRIDHAKLEPNSPRILCILASTRFNAALKMIEGTIPDLIKEYPWTSQPAKADQGSISISR